MLPTLEIRRYKNRKLYCPETRSYMAIHEVGDALAKGRMVRVTCNETKRNMTRDVLGYVVMQLSGRPGRVPEAHLVEFIRAHKLEDPQAHAEDLRYA